MYIYGASFDTAGRKIRCIVALDHSFRQVGITRRVDLTVELNFSTVTRWHCNAHSATTCARYSNMHGTNTDLRCHTVCVRLSSSAPAGLADLLTRPDKAFPPCCASRPYLGNVHRSCIVVMWLWDPVLPRRWATSCDAEHTIWRLSARAYVCSQRDNDSLPHCMPRRALARW